MAKRRFRSRGRFSRVRRRRRGGNKRLKRFVKGVVSRMSEIKYRTAGSSLSFDPVSGTTIEMTPIFPQGVTEYLRIGAKIRYKFIHIDETISLADGSSAGTPNFTYVRRIIFWTRLPYIAPALVTNSLFIFDDPGTTAWISTTRPKNIKIVSDKLIPMSVVTQAQNSQITSARRWKKRFRVRNSVTFGVNADGTDDNLPRDPIDRLYCVIIAPGVVNDLLVNYTWHTKFSYRDM